MHEDDIYVNRCLTNRIPSYNKDWREWLPAAFIPAASAQQCPEQPQDGAAAADDPEISLALPEWPSADYTLPPCVAIGDGVRRCNSAESALISNGYRMFLPSLLPRPADGVPMPRRSCPYRFFEAHHVHPDPAFIWTHEEYRLRHTRNLLIKELLRDGAFIQYQQLGWSLYPTVHHGDCCLYETVADPSMLTEGDFVFCQLKAANLWDRENGRRRMASHRKLFYTGPIKEVGRHDGRLCFKFVNGWCFARRVYGRLIEVIRTAE